MGTASARLKFCLIFATMTAACGSNDPTSSSPRAASGAEAMTAASGDAQPRLGRSPGVGCNYTTAVAWDEESFARICQQAFQVWNLGRKIRDASEAYKEPRATDLATDYEGFCGAVTIRGPLNAGRFSKYLTSLNPEDHLLVKSCPVQIMTLSRGIRRISDETARAISPKPVSSLSSETKAR